MRRELVSLYKKTYQISTKLAQQYGFVNSIIRFINLGRTFWLITILKDIPAIKNIFENWPTFILDCFGLVRKRYIIYKLRNGIKYKVRANTIDVGVLYEVIVVKSYCQDNLKFEKNDVVIDIGSHIGTFSLLIASNFPDVHIYAFEPQPANFKLLLENISINKLLNITAVNKAILDKKSLIRFYENKNNFAGHTFFPNDTTGFDELKVKTVTLENIMDSFSINKVKLLKVDCEGSEYSIFFNCPDNILKKVHSIAVEFHNLDSQQNGNTLKSFFKKKKFRNIKISEFPSSIMYCKRF